MSKIAFITGGSRGIGLGIAQALAADGWNLIINGVRPIEEVADVLTGLRSQGVKVDYVQADISSAAARASLKLQVRDLAGGAVNLLVNNAGVAPKQRNDILETTEDSWDFVLNTNLKGTFFLSQFIARAMIAQRKRDPSFSAAIINITSMSATVASINRGEYCVAKAGLAMLTQLLAVRLGPEEIPVYEVRPGVIKTDMTAAVTEKYDRLIADGLCLQSRWGLPSDVGRAVASLARGDFAFSTGQTILVDGGLTVPRL